MVRTSAFAMTVCSWSKPLGDTIRWCPLLYPRTGRLRATGFPSAPASLGKTIARPSPRWYCSPETSAQRCRWDRSVARMADYLFVPQSVLDQWSEKGRVEVKGE